MYKNIKKTTNKYEPLKINFDIPEILQRNIEEFIQNLNERNGNLADCYEEEIRSLLNYCDADLNENQIELLRAYYCKGGIYE